MGFLRMRPEVQHFEIRDVRELYVKFKDGVIEHWVYNDSYADYFRKKYRSYIIPYDHGEYPFDDNFPKLCSIYDINPLDPDCEIKKEQFNLTPQYLSKFKFCNRRVFFHRLALQLAFEEHPYVWCSPDVVSRIKKKVDNIPLRKIMISDTSFLESSSHSIFVRPLTCQCIDFRSQITQQRRWSPSFLWWIIEWLYRNRKNINRMSIVHSMRRRRHVFLKIGHPVALYIALRVMFGSNIQVVNLSSQWWADVVVMLTENNQDADTTIYVADKDTGQRPIAIFDDNGKYEIGSHWIFKDNHRINIMRD